MRLDLFFFAADYICLSTPQNDPYRALPSVFHPLLELMGWLDVPTFDGSIKLKYSEKVALSFCGLFMATIFGGIHYFAWSSAFPTYQEQAIWRISAVTSICAPWLGFLVGWLFAIVNCESRVLALLGSMVRVLCAMLYITGRAILLILMVATLRSLPPDAYEEAPWISQVPHLSVVLYLWYLWCTLVVLLWRHQYTRHVHR